MNDDLRSRRSWLETPPPVLLFPDKTDVAPTRLQPRIDPDPRFSHLPDLPHDLRDLEERERPHSPSLLRPRLPEPEQEYLTTYRHLLPRQYRYFLRHSPYPRLLLVASMVAVAVLGGLWVNQAQQTQAIAAGSYRVARDASHAALDAAAAYGVDPRLLHPLYVRSRYLDSISPSGFILSRSRLQFYGTQERRYRSLLQTVRRLENHALAYWTRQEEEAYTALVAATIQAKNLGMSLQIPLVPACAAPRCLRAAVAGQWAQTRRLRHPSTPRHIDRRKTAAPAGGLSPVAR